MVFFIDEARLTNVNKKMVFFIEGFPYKMTFVGWPTMGPKASHTTSQVKNKCDQVTNLPKQDCFEIDN